MLDRARGRINEERFDGEMLDLAKLLASRPLGDSVIEREEEFVNRLQTLLELLQSEDRQKKSPARKKRIADLVKDVNKLIGEQRGARQATESPASKSNPSKAADAQSKVAKKTDDLLKKIDGQDAERNAEKPRKMASRSPRRTPRNRKPSRRRGINRRACPKMATSRQVTSPRKRETRLRKTGCRKNRCQSLGVQPGRVETFPVEVFPPKPPKGKPMRVNLCRATVGHAPCGGGNSRVADSRKSTEEQPAEQSTPGRKDLDEAKKEMEKAVEDLKNEQRQAAGEKQDEALRKLIAAKEKLEEILRQFGGREGTDAGRPRSPVPADAGLAVEGLRRHRAVGQSRRR